MINSQCAEGAGLISCLFWNTLHVLLVFFCSDLFKLFGGRVVELKLELNSSARFHVVTLFELPHWMM